MARVLDCTLNRHVRFVRHIRDEDKQGDDEDGLYALARHGLFAEFGFSHVAESSEVGFVLAGRVYDSEESGRRCATVVCLSKL